MQWFAGLHQFPWQQHIFICLTSHRNRQNMHVGAKDAAEGVPSGFATAAGFPASALTSEVSSFSVSDQPDPCISPAAGYSVGLTAQFYAAPYNQYQAYPLPIGPANFTRCYS